MRILVLGCKGFIGYHTFQYFANFPEHDCWGCDILVDYTSEKYILLTDFDNDFNEIFRCNTYDVCINCSGAASVPESLIHPMRDFGLNTFTVVKLLEAIRRHAPSCKFINLSSAAVYGNPLTLPIKEDALLKPISPYGYHKQMAENLCEEFHRFYDVSTCSARIFSAYGNGSKKQLFWDLAQKFKDSRNVPLFGTGAESRDFIHITDIVSAIELIMTKGCFEASCYNIANGEEITIRDVAEKLELLFGYQKKLAFAGDHRKGDPLNWKADISKIKSLGYQQQVSIDMGLLKYVKWLQEEKLL